MEKPVEVKSLSRYKIHIKFDDGIEGDIDLSDSAGKGIFKFWDSGNNFDNVYINKETGGIAWNEEL